MANIFLTRKCNLKCPYCFADEFVNKKNEEISIDNFKKALSFIKTNSDFVGLIGGEPTLHSRFNEILDILIEDKKINIVSLFTNGLEIDKYIDKLRNKKFHILINTNSYKDIGEVKYQKLKNNIKLLKENKKKEFVLGINLYSNTLDYSFIFDLLQTAEKNNLRFSTAISNSNKENTCNALENFKRIKPYLMQFLNDCLEKGIVPYNDCNAIPDCILDIKDKRVLLKLSILGNKTKNKTPIATTNTCLPVIDILPDLTAVRCFGLSKNMRIPISDFKSVEILRTYFYNNIDIYNRLTFISNRCIDCNSRLYDKCGLCFTYKLKAMKKIKQSIIRQKIKKKVK